MTRLLLIVMVLVLPACAHLFGREARKTAAARAQLWHEAHVALYDEAFPRAESLFTMLADEHPGTDEGREAIFYVGSLHLDPRNRQGNPERAETAFDRYLQLDTVGGIIHRRPEATTMLAIARQRNTVALEVPTPAPPGVEPPPRAPASLRDLQDENERLRRQVAQRDEQIRRQREELDRIRRALAPRNP
jgi:hypothetical protein